MRKINLMPIVEYGHRSEYAIMDITDVKNTVAEAGKKRGTISVDYTPFDIESLKAEGMDLDAAIAHYRHKIYNMVKLYISGDWEDSSGSLEAALATVKKYIANRF